MYDNNSVLNYRWNQNGKISINPEHMYVGDYATKYGETKSLTLWYYFVSVLKKDTITKESNMSYRNLK